MAKNKKPDGEPQLERDGQDFSAAPDDVRAAGDAQADELTALKARLAELQADRDAKAAELEKLKAGTAPAFGGGGRFRVSLKDAPSWVVECEPGEHPFEAYKRETGVISSIHAPVITPTDEPLTRPRPEPMPA